MLDYERLTVRDLKRIVNRREATPAAIGLFVLYDFWERGHSRRAIVDNSLLRYIESKWQFSPHANELDFWVELSQQLKLLEFQALEQGQRAMLAFMQADKRIGYLLLVAYRREYQQQLTEAATVSDINAEQFLKELGERLDRLEGHFAGSNYMPTLEEIEREVEDMRTNTANFLGYIQVMAMAEALLGISLTEFGVSGVSLYPWVTQRDAQFKIQFDEYPTLDEDVSDTDIAPLLKRLTTIGFVRPSSDVIASVERALGAYLSSSWSAWARAGVKLRELADSSTGIVDLIRHAELAAAELTHE